MKRKPARDSARGDSQDPLHTRSGNCMHYPLNPPVGLWLRQRVSRLRLQSRTLSTSDSYRVRIAVNARTTRFVIYEITRGRRALAIPFLMNSHGITIESISIERIRYTIVISSEFLFSGRASIFPRKSRDASFDALWADFPDYPKEL